MEMSKAKKAKIVGGSPLMLGIGNARMEGAMQRPDRPKTDMPDWAKNPEKYQYQMGSGLKDTNPNSQLKRKVIKKSGVTRPRVWDIDDVLINKTK